MVNPLIHETALVEHGAQVGEGTRIWHWTHVCNGAQIGSGCSLGQNVYIGPKAVIGKNVKIQNNISVYDGVILEDNVFCGPSMVFTNVRNPRCEYPRRDKYEKTLVRKGATLGANCTVLCGTTIGRYAFIGAGAVVTRDVPDYALMVGSPARQIGWMSEYGEKMDLPLSGPGEYVCPHMGKKYILSNSRVSTA